MPINYSSVVLPRHESADRGLTHSQLQILIGQRLDPQCPLYNMAFAFVFTGELRVELFQRAWTQVVGESDALRTCIDNEQGIGVRRIRDVSDYATTVIDFRAKPDPDQHFRRWCHERSGRPLPLDGPLVDSVLVQLGPDRTGWYLNQHHVITDAWSTVLVYRQLAAHYERLRGVDRRLTMHRPYYETVASLASPPSARAAARTHWGARQGKRCTVAFYGRDKSPAGTASTRLTLALDEARSSALDDLAGQRGFLTLSRDMSRYVVFATLLIGWLHRISEASELGFDAPVTGRPTADAKRTIGLFMEMFPFRVTVDPGETFRSLGAKCLSEAQAFLQHALPGTSAPSTATASNVVLNFFPASFGSFAGFPTTCEWVHAGHGDRGHGLRLQVHDFSASGRYTLHFDFNTEVLPTRLRERGLEHVSRLLTAMLETPDQPIARVSLLTEDERQALAALNQTSTAPTPERSVVEMFAAQAEQTPESVALRQGSESVTFHQLHRDTEALSRALALRGVEPGSAVAVLGKRSTRIVTAVLAVLRAGAAYLPLDRTAPKQRLEDLLRDAGVRVLLTDGDVEPFTRPPGLAVIPIADAVESGRGGRPCERPEPRLEDLAYLMYTSGSTGRPKGVLVEHGGLVDYLEWAARQYVRSDQLTFPLFTALSFDLTVTSLFLPLITGGTLDIYPEAEGPVDSALMEVIRANRVDFIKLTPSHLSLLRQVDLSRSRITRMVVGGEDFPTNLAAAISAQCRDQLEIYNEYGPTEAIVGCVAHRYDSQRDTGASVPIGRPADHVTIEILNPALSAVPEGTPGELWISRFGLARGYHGLDTATAERFGPDPANPGQRRYRTGDLVRLADPDTLAYLGRIDRQVKISGWRVEPGEIEAAVLAIPGVEQCAVVTRTQTPTPSSDDDPTLCIRCGLSSAYPSATIDTDGVCSICRSYDSIKDRAGAYFRTMADLRALFDESARSRRAAYDCMLLLSGGKDSTYALCRLVEMGLSVYAFTLDNGFISEEAKDNMRRVTDQLGVPLELGRTPAMPAIFKDSLERFSNVCHGCFKTIYTLSTNRARALGIPIIVTGLSRGQMFETRLSEHIFRDGNYGPDEVDAAVLEARKAYHRVPDEVSRSLDVEIFQDDRVFDEIRFVDFYRYCDVDLQDLLAYLKRTVPWVRPADTGRSTNCLINDVGIYIHKKERGFHNYALPYSWDVRLGHKTRDGALAELDDQIDVGRVREILSEVGYDEDRLAQTPRATLAAFYVGADHISESAIREQLADQLPRSLVPTAVTRVASIPLTVHGKVDEAALFQLDAHTGAEPYREPDGPVEAYLAESWQQQLGVERVGVDDSFFELGGTSLAALEVTIRLCREFDIELPLETLFHHPTIRQLARVAEQRILDDVAEMAETDRE